MTIYTHRILKPINVCDRGSSPLSHSRQPQKGAVMVEAGFALTLFLILLLVLVDLSMTFTTWSALANSTSQAVREIGVHMAAYQGTSSCQALESTLQSTSQATVRSYHGLSDSTVNVSISAPSDTPYWTIFLDAETSRTCLILCRLFSFPYTISIQRHSLVENRDFSC